MSILWETLGFAARSAIVFVTFAACVLVLVLALRGRRSAGRAGRLEVRRLDDRLDERAQTLREATMTPRDAQREHRRWVKARKEQPRRKERAFVLEFKGDVMATAVEHLRAEVTTILAAIAPGDRVLVKLESPGGAAHVYGLAAAQLARFRERGVPLTVAVDRVAASGGYMMACVADEIVAAPFAIVGSIGVAAPVPNAHRLLERFGVDYETATAGRYKRTVTFLGANTEEGRRKFQEQLEEVHALFKSFVRRYRPALDVEAVATGEHWHGLRGLELGLVDRLATSDDVLVEWASERDLYELRFHAPRGLGERLGHLASSAVEGALAAVEERLASPLG